MRKGEKFVISHELDSADFAQDLNEIVKKHGTDAQVVFEHLALGLERRLLEDIKAKRPPGQPGRPRGIQADSERVKRFRGDRPIAIIADLLGVSYETVKRIENNIPVRAGTVAKINRNLKKLEQRAQKKGPQKTQ